MDSLRNYATLLEDHGVTVTGDCKFKQLAKPVSKSLVDCLTFATNKHELDRARRGGAAVVLIEKGEVANQQSGVDTCVVEVEGAMQLFYGIHQLTTPGRNNEFGWVVEPSIISPTANIHESAYVSPFGVKIGDKAVVGPNCSLLPGCIVGEEVTLRSNVVLADECLEVKNIGGRNRTVEHKGMVYLSKYVDLHAGVTVSKGLFLGDLTSVGESVVIGDRCHVAHGAEIGKDTIVAAGSVICGYVSVGDKVWIGPSCTISNRLNIGSGARLNIGSVVIRNIKAGEELSALYAGPHKHMMLQNARNQK